MMWLEKEIWNKRVCNYYLTSVLFFIAGGIPSGNLSLPALHLSGTSSLQTGTRPPSCFYLDNRLLMMAEEQTFCPVHIQVLAWITDHSMIRLFLTIWLPDMSDNRYPSVWPDFRSLLFVSFILVTDILTKFLTAHIKQILKWIVEWSILGTYMLPVSYSTQLENWHQR